jgi:hypothetical protein
MRVFYKVLEVYEQEKMTGGYADSITLSLFDDGLNGDPLGMSDRTFQNLFYPLKMLVLLLVPVQWLRLQIFLKPMALLFPMLL